MEARATNEIPTTPGAYTNGFKLQNVKFIDQFSHAGQQIAFDDSKMRYCLLPVHESICEPISHRGSFGHNLNEGFEEYAPRQNAGNRTDSLCEWAIAISEKGRNKPLDEVIRGSHVMSDRSTLMKIASTPYVKHRYGWKLDAFRIGHTLLVCPYAIEEEQAHFNTNGGLKGLFRLEQTKSIITEKINSNEETICAANTYHRVMTARLTDGGRSLKLLYVTQVDCVNRQTQNAIEVRTHGKRMRDEDWLEKTLKWYILSRLSASPQMLIGVRDASDHLVGIEQLPTDFMRDFAEINGAWKSKTCFAFLYKVLDRMRDLLEGKPDGQRLTASYAPKDSKVSFQVHAADAPPQLFVSEEFWQKFAAGMNA